MLFENVQVSGGFFSSLGLGLRGFGWSLLPLLLGIGWIVWQPRGLGGENTLAPIAGLLDRARAAGVPVIYVHSVREATNPEFTVFNVDEHLMRGSWGAEYCEEIAPQPGEPIVDKQCHDCFARTEMEGVLARLGIHALDHTVIVTGVALDVCVSHAALGFSVRDYFVAVPMDC